MTQKRMVIFDLVATITDAGDRYARAFIDVCAANDIAPPAAEDVLDMLGNKNLSEITDAFVGSKLDSAAKKDFMDSCNTACDTMLGSAGWHEKLFPHVVETLDALQSRGYLLGVFTGTREDAMIEQLQYHNITHYFPADRMKGKDNARDAGKTSVDLKKEHISAIITAGGCTNDNVTIVGDSESDFRAAEALGLNFIGIAHNDRQRAALEKCGVTVIISSMKDLAAALKPPAPPETGAPRLKR
jgi:phosphoglycolate phosphatase